MVCLESRDMRQHLRGPGICGGCGARHFADPEVEFESAAHEAAIQKHCV